MHTRARYPIAALVVMTLAPSARTTELPSPGTSGLPSVRTSGLANVRTSGLPNFRTSVTFQKPVPLFDGRTFQGWEGDTKQTWRIQNGALVGGSLTEEVPRNDFLVTTRSYGNFVLRLTFKLEGTEGFINGGVQFRSQRAINPAHEMVGYQADLGDKYWGSLYDESRRNKVLVQADPALIAQILKVNDWNEYEIRAEGRRIRLSINGKQTVDYTEADESIPQTGLIGLQIHGGGKAQVSYKNITIEELR